MARSACPERVGERGNRAEDIDSVATLVYPRLRMIVGKTAVLEVSASASSIFSCLTRRDMIDGACENTHVGKYQQVDMRIFRSIFDGISNSTILIRLVIS